MPALSAITLVDRLLEHGDSRSVEKSDSHPKPIPKPKPIPNSNLDRRNVISTSERKAPWPQIKPALYATPEIPPLPGSPTSFPPSPYVIDHKRRGPRLLKSSSVVDVAAKGEDVAGQKPTGNKETSESGVSNSTGDVKGIFQVESVNDVQSFESGRIKDIHEVSEGKPWENDLQCKNSKIEFIDCRSRISLSTEKGSLKKILCSPQKDIVSDDFFDPQDSLSYTSNTDVEENNAEGHALRPGTPGAEFYDAWEELSSDGGAQSLARDLQAELREMRLNLLMEMENRKQAEESVANMQRQWEKIRQKLLLVGLTVPLLSANEDETLNFDIVEDLSQQVAVARFVSESVGRGIAKAEVETEMEALVESKNFEIARLTDRLHYYEAMNHEMCQRNQEAIELARRNRERRKRKQKWIWGSVAATIVLGSAALLWPSLPSASVSSSGNAAQPACRYI